MTDINALINNAIATAVAEATQPLIERVAALESVCTTQHSAMVAMRVRISTLESKTNEANMAEFVEGEILATLAVTDIVGEDRVAKIESRIAALENNPAQGADTQAAPDLLAVLKDVADYWAGGDVPADLDARMRAAIATATGEA